MTAGGVPRAPPAPLRREASIERNRSVTSRICATLASAIREASLLALAEPLPSPARSRRSSAAPRLGHKSRGPSQASAATRAEARSRSRSPVDAYNKAELDDASSDIEVALHEAAPLVEAPLAAVAA
mmetsp:Transcript_13866/g.35488  ORF Transcript_13866/g.35488 Transcript_13866/m.35488 type:complete len:127 (-) Transcript_13866:180-560(-)